MARTKKKSSTLAKLRELNETQNSLITDLQVYIDALELDRQALLTLEPVIKSVQSIYIPNEKPTDADIITGPDNGQDLPISATPSKRRNKKVEVHTDETATPPAPLENGNEQGEPNQQGE